MDVGKAGSDQRIERSVGAMQIVLRELDLRMVEPDVGVIRKGQADAVAQGEHKLSVRNVILQPLRRRERPRELLAAADAEQPLQPWRLLRQRREAGGHIQCDQSKHKTQHSQ